MVSSVLTLQRHVSEARQWSGIRKLTFVIYDMSRILEVERVYDLVEAIVLIAVQVRSLSPMSRALLKVSEVASTLRNNILVEEQSIVRLSGRYQPVHRLDHVRPSRDLSRVTAVIGEHDDVLGFITVALYVDILVRYHVSQSGGGTHR